MSMKPELEKEIEDLKVTMVNRLSKITKDIDSNNTTLGDKISVAMTSIQKEIDESLKTDLSSLV